MNSKNNWYNTRKKFGIIECGKEIFPHHSMIPHRIIHDDNLGFKIKDMDYGHNVADMKKVSSSNEAW